MLVHFFKQLLLISAIAGGLYLILKLLSALTQKYFSAAWHYYSNIIVYTFFLVPYYKIVSLFDLNFEPITKSGPGLLPLMGLNQPSAINPAATEATLLQAQSYTAVSFRFDSAPYILMTGTLIFVTVILVQNYHLHRRIFRTSPLTAEEQILEILFMCKQKLGITKEIPVYLAPYISTPFLYGIFKPRIVLPDIEFTKEELQYVFLHELTHWKRHDPWLKGLLLFINAIHWFNPLVYMARRDIDRFCEQSCDESVIKPMNKQERRRYCELILHVLWNVADQNTQLFSAFSDKRKHLERRINMILKSEGSKSKRSVRMIAIAMTLVISGLGMSAAVYATSERIPQAPVQTAVITSSSSASSTERSAKIEADTPSAEPVTEKALPEYWKMGALNVNGMPYLPLVATAENLGYTVNIVSKNIDPESNPKYPNTVEYNYELIKDGKSLGMASLDISDGKVVTSMTDGIFFNTHDQATHTSIVLQKDTVYMPAQFFKEALDTGNKLP